MMNAAPIRRDILAGWPVLVVEDDPDSLWVTKRILSHYGADVHTASNGRMGWDKVREVRPRFVICDLSMPEVDGWEFIDRLQKDRATSDIPVVALTAHAMVGDRQRAIAAGFHNYLTKPLTPATFMRDLLQLLMDVPALEVDLRH